MRWRNSRLGTGTTRDCLSETGREGGRGGASPHFRERRTEGRQRRALRRPHQGHSKGRGDWCTIRHRP